VAGTSVKLLHHASMRQESNKKKWKFKHAEENDNLLKDPYSL